MKLFAQDNSSWLSIDLIRSHEGGIESTTFRVECNIDIKHGKFTAVNYDVHFFDLDHFMKSFGQFREGNIDAVSLTGTYDTKISFIKNKKNKRVVHFAVGDSFSGYSEMADYSLSGLFEINDQSLHFYDEEFNNIFGPYNNGIEPDRE
ncbi:MAG: hypothetical protein ACYC69_05430 [Thermodesulfovibrionales bacterium]